jgi:anti-sigma B factor antagonist
MGFPLQGQRDLTRAQDYGTDPLDTEVVFEQANAGYESFDDGSGRTALFESLADLPEGMIIRYSGTMDRQAGPWFAALCLDRVDVGYIRLALDLAGLQWVASPGLGCLTGILKAVKPRGGRLVLFAVPPKIDEVFQLLGFHQFFDIVDTETEALVLLRRNQSGLEEPKFPKIFKCPICNVRTRVAKPMRGRCRRCGTVLRVVPEGQVLLG